MTPSQTARVRTTGSKEVDFTKSQPPNSRCFLWGHLSFMELDGSGDARCGCHDPL